MDGSGTAVDPWIITNATDLQTMENNLGSYYRIDRDINASGTAAWNGGLGFDPVGQSGTPFTGYLDGEGHVISNLTMARTDDADDHGLFGYINGGSVINLIMTGASIAVTVIPSSASTYIGILAGNLFGAATITNCRTAGAITGNSRYATGGLVGYQGGGTISECSSSATITISTDYCDGDYGGLVGYPGGGTIEKSYATGDIALTCINVTFFSGQAGGFVGKSDISATIDDCYSRGDITITTGDSVNDTGYIGGFLGYGDVTLDDCYSTGAPSAHANNTIGGFCADKDGGSITNCFWDTTTSGEAVSDGGTGKTTAQMKAVATFQAAGWAISRVWNVLASCNAGYPCLIGVNECCMASSGDSVDQTIIGNKVSLEAIRNIEITYGGRFYIDKSGNAIYESRYHRNV